MLALSADADRACFTASRRDMHVRSLTDYNNLLICATTQSSPVADWSVCPTVGPDSVSVMHSV